MRTATSSEEVNTLEQQSYGLTVMVVPEDLSDVIALANSRDDPQVHYSIWERRSRVRTMADR